MRRYLRATKITNSGPTPPAVHIYNQNRQENTQYTQRTTAHHKGYQYDSINETARSWYINQRFRSLRQRRFPGYPKHYSPVRIFHTHPPFHHKPNIAKSIEASPPSVQSPQTQNPNTQSSIQTSTTQNFQTTTHHPTPKHN